MIPMKEYELFGGSQDGELIELDGEQRVGATLFIAAAGQQASEVYALCSDGRFRFLAYGATRISPAHESS
jgi:hypothetical protein